MSSDVVNIRKQKVVFFYRGDFPEGSHGLRLRLLSRGLSLNSVESEIIIAYPPPSREAVAGLLPNEHFALPPVDLPQTEIQKIINKVKGTYKAYRLLVSAGENVSAVLQTGLGFLEGFFVMWYCRAKGAKYFIEANDINRWRLSDRKLTFVERLASLQLELFDRFVLKHVDAVFAVSSYLERHYRSLYSYLTVKRIQPAIVDIDSYNYLVDRGIPDSMKERLQVFESGRTKVVYAGSCRETNGLMFFLDCADQVFQDYPGDEFDLILLLTVGHIRELVLYSESLRIRDRVHVITAVPQPVIPAIYAVSDILVIAEMGDVIANAGFPSKVGEYLASGKAILSTTFSDITEILTHGQNGMLSPVGDAKGYMGNLLRLLKDEELRTRLGRHAVRTAAELLHPRSAVAPLLEELP